MLQIFFKLILLNQKYLLELNEETETINMKFIN